MRLHTHCQNPACGSELREPLRADAKFCNSTCRREASRAAREGLPDAEAPQRFRDGYATVRRRHSALTRRLRDTPAPAVAA